jgi:hypothetical protein
MDSVRGDDDDTEEGRFPRVWWEVCGSRPFTLFRTDDVDKVKATALPEPSSVTRNGNRRAVSARIFMVTMYGIMFTNEPPINHHESSIIDHGHRDEKTKSKSMTQKK